MKMVKSTKSKQSSQTTRKQVKSKSKSVARRSLAKQYNASATSDYSSSDNLLKKSNRNTGNLRREAMGPQRGTSQLKNPAKRTSSSNENQFTDGSMYTDGGNGSKKSRKATATKNTKKRKTSGKTSKTLTESRKESMTKITKYMAPKQRDSSREEREISEGNQSTSSQKQTDETQSGRTVSERLTDEDMFAGGDESVSDGMNTEHETETSQTDQSQTEERTPTERSPKQAQRNTSSESVRSSKPKNETTGSQRKRKQDDSREERNPVSAQQGRQTKSKRQKANFTVNQHDVISHMADREFVHSQIKRISLPFCLHSGPSQWMKIWRSRASSDSDDNETPLPKNVMENAVRKLNRRLTDSVQKEFSRAKQRRIVEELDCYRKELKETLINNHGFGKTKTGASLDELLETYPMEWPYDSSLDQNTETEEQIAQKMERYSDLRAEVFALNKSVLVGRKEVQQFTTLLSLASQAENWKDSCSSDVLAKELDRTQSLLLQVYQKLQNQKGDS